MATQASERTHIKTARIVGVLILAATATYMTGTGQIDAILSTPDYLLHVYPNRVQIITGVLLQFVNCAAVAGIGVVIFPIVKKESQPVALGYLVTRILECTFLRERMMSNELNPTGDLNQPMVYQIRIQGHLGPQWTAPFEGLTLTLEDNGETLLTGPVVDQAALHGLLRKVRDLGLPLIAVTRIKSGRTDTSDVSPTQ